MILKEKINRVVAIPGSRNLNTNASEESSLANCSKYSLEQRFPDCAASTHHQVLSRRDAMICDCAEQARLFCGVECRCERDGDAYSHHLRMSLSHSDRECYCMRVSKRGCGPPSFNAGSGARPRVPTWHRVHMLMRITISERYICIAGCAGEWIWNVMVWVWSARENVSWN